ncbi:MAG: hypothetical protein ACKVS6_09195 [Planctomycetota bacterium]
MLQERCNAAKTRAYTVLGECGTRASLVPPFAAGPVPSLDTEHVSRIVNSIKKENSDTVALLCATRDDLGDSGVSVLIQIARELRAALPSLKIEFHISDLGGSIRALRELLKTSPALVHHAITAPPRLYKTALPGFDYVRSLDVMRIVKEEFDTIQLRSTFCLGLGESRDEIIASLADLKSVRCDEVFLVPADLVLKNPMPAPESLERVRSIMEKLTFSRIEFLQFPRSCAAAVAPGAAAVSLPAASAPAIKVKKARKQIDKKPQS